MSKQRAQQLYKLADSLLKVNVASLSEAQKAERNSMVARLQEELKTLKGIKEAPGDLGSQIVYLYNNIYELGDDAVDHLYNNAPLFAQYWDQYEGDLDSIIQEVPPQQLQKIYAELNKAAQEEGLTEMDSQGYTGSRDRKSSSKYGSRDDYELGQPETTLGKDSIMTGHEASNQALDALKNAFDDEYDEVEETTGKFDRKEIAPGRTQYTRKDDTYTTDGSSVADYRVLAPGRSIEDDNEREFNPRDDEEYELEEAISTEAYDRLKKVFDFSNFKG